jgi:hypothetical protein
MGIGIGNKMSVLGGNALKTIVYMEKKLSGKNAVNIYPPISLSPYLPPKKGYLNVMDFF